MPPVAYQPHTVYQKIDQPTTKTRSKIIYVPLKKNIQKTNEPPPHAFLKAPRTLTFASCALPSISLRFLCLLL